jgi:CHAD domain-containing protein
MTKTRNNPPKARPAPQRRPSFVVETSLAEVVVPKLDAWLDDLAAAIPRVINHADTEAVHDLRVAMRRIRSLLRVVRSVFGRYYVNLVRTELKQVAGATGSLRDEEVLAETIRALALSGEHRKALEPWLARRAERENALRATVVQLLSSGALEEPRKHLRALIRLPVRPNHDKEALKFSRKVVFSAHAQVEALRTADVEDAVGMHDLRIAYKRLRYAVEALGPALPPELRAWGQVATKFQKVLGSLHDQDVAVEIVRNAKTLSEDTRAAVLEALAKMRGLYAQRYLDMVGFEVEEPVADAALVEAESKRKRKKKGRKAKPDSKEGTEKPNGPNKAVTSKPAANTAATKRVRPSARKAPAKEAPAKEAPAKEAPAKEAPAKKAPAKKAPAKKAPAKKAPAKKAPAKSSKRPSAAKKTPTL